MLQGRLIMVCQTSPLDIWPTFTHLLGYWSLANSNRLPLVGDFSPGNLSTTTVLTDLWQGRNSCMWFLNGSYHMVNNFVKILRVCFWSSIYNSTLKRTSWKYTGNSDHKAENYSRFPLGRSKYVVFCLFAGVSVYVCKLVATDVGHADRLFFFCAAKQKTTYNEKPWNVNVFRFRNRSLTHIKNFSKYELLCWWFSKVTWSTATKQVWTHFTNFCSVSRELRMAVILLLVLLLVHGWIKCGMNRT